VSAATLLDQLTAAGIRLGRDEDDLIVDVLPDTDLDPYRERIQAAKPALLTLLTLQDDIVRTASAAQHAFDRQHYDQLWQRWHALQAQEAT
jgi:hypothetical protein